MYRSVQTCAQEEDLVVAVCGGHLVHSDGGVLVVRLRSDHQGPPAHGVDRIEHDRVVPDKRHHVVRELLGALNVRGEGSAWTLEGGRQGGKERARAREREICYRGEYIPTTQLCDKGT